MKKLLLASHGKLASGLKSTIGIIYGECDYITSIDSYGEDGDPDEKIKDYFNNIEENDEVIVLVDIAFGSVAQKIIPLQKENITIISGMNITLALGILTSDNWNNLIDTINESRESISIVKLNCNDDCDD